MEPIEGVKGELFVVFYLSFVNPSTIPKSIYRLNFEPQEKYQLHGVNGVPNSELTQMRYRPFGNDCKGCVLPFDDIAVFPLDVEPLHSKTVALPVLISPFQFERNERSKLSNKLIGHLVAFDHQNHQMTKAPLEFPA
ncbi:MAG: hypothetical protein A2Z28_04570 [Chloroflexi bacterium RBG_16_51_9]|nr:MAG: hypothetical protein A2Z28_04570 [Chloroflexi bacterium RBG_16_51_9]